MAIQIHRIPLGPTNCYLIRDAGTILVNAGTPDKSRKFSKALSRLSINPRDISLILLTHCHWGHMGSVAELKALTGAKVAIHQNGKDWVEREGLVTGPPPTTSLWGSLARATAARLLTATVSYPRTTVDLVLGDDEFSLSNYGINGTVLHTPGHSSDSVSLLLDTGDAFLGDLAMNGFPMRIGPGMPFFAEDVDAVREGWRLLLQKGAKTFYPAHGKPFAADRLRRLL
ncbi:MAG: MBL fold metallo-hydrolase [Chloroflexi bacterium]|nr:MBL fold metallo-hydrolase [Chloroflexota bacterium]